MSEQQSSYRQIMKATSLFGGVQVFNIIIIIIRSKFVALLLGPAGMGINGLLTTTLSLIDGLTNFGLSTSAIKDISEANNSRDEIRISRILIIVKRLVWITGMLGTIVTIILSPWLSQLTFGNKDYTLAFIFISITLLLNQISVGQTVLLRGLRKLKYVAQSGMIGSFIGLITTIPLYYLFDIKGIVPSIIVTSIVTLLLTTIYANKVKIKPVYVSKSRTIAASKGMLKMGFAITISGFITIGASYLIRIIINNKGGLSEVGLYSAGFAIIETYVGLVFSAMGTDYFPRLSAVNNDNNKIRQLVNQQAVIALLIITPIIIIFLIYSPILIQLLYSKTFLPIEKMISLAIMGILFRTVSWTMGFILFAKSDSRLFIKTAIGFNIIFFVNNLLGYSISGLTGLGGSFMLNYFIHLIALFFITKYRYQFNFNAELVKIFIICLFICLFGLVFSYLSNPLLKYSTGSILIVISIVFSLIQLDKKLDIKGLLLKQNK